jgi:glutamine amidotransferase
VPHMGWNQVRHAAACPLFAGLEQDVSYYFVHSFYASDSDQAEVAGLTQYGKTKFASALWRDNVFATQFHPEKSQRQGLALYRNFWKLARRSRRGR